MKDFNLICIKEKKNFSLNFNFSDDLSETAKMKRENDQSLYLMSLGNT